MPFALDVAQAQHVLADEQSIFSKMASWFSLTEDLCSMHEQVIAQARAGKIPNLTPNGLRQWQRDMERLRKIMRIQQEMC